DHEPSERRRFVEILNGIFHGALARESYTQSQIFYFGKVRGSRYETARVQGGYLDVMAEERSLKPWRPVQKRDSSGVTPIEAAAQATEQTLADLRCAAEYLRDHDGLVEYKAWIDAGMALASLRYSPFAEQARQIWLDVSDPAAQQAPDYQPDA